MNNKYSIRNRSSNFELLRIVSMTMVVVMHVLRHGGILQTLTVGSLEYWFLWGMESLSFVGVNCYLLLTGYFQVQAQFRWKKVIALVVQLMFYAALSEVVLVIMTGKVKLKDILLVIDPIGNNVYWFASQYLILYVMSPYINQMLAALSKDSHKRLIVILTVMCGVYPTIAFWAKNTFGIGNNIAWFITMYVAAAFFRLYDVKISMKTAITGYLVCTAILLLSRFVLDKVGTLIHFDSDLGKLLFYYNSPVVAISSICVFMCFKQINIEKLRFKRAINLVASLCFGVYLIHDSDILRTELWRVIDLHINNGLLTFMGKMSVVVGGIFICGCIIEFIRRTIGDCIMHFIKSVQKLLASGDRDHILSGVFSQFLSEKSEPAE